MSPELALRPATAGDLAAVAELHLAVRADGVPAMPPLVHDPHEVRRHVAGWDLARHEVWLAEDDERVLGYLRLSGSWLDDLYVAVPAQRRGVGSALLELAMGLRPDGFCLWVFASNAPARAFYAAHGLVELETTDGSANEEQAPDVRVAWPGARPWEFWRGLIDEVDAELGDLLARRAALSGAVRRLRGGPGRDRDREREVARRMAERVPALGPERVARVVDVIITESLEAAAGPGEPDPG